MSEDETALLEAVFHHLVLPPKLPQCFDGDNIDLKRSLGERLLVIFRLFNDIGDPNVWRTLDASFQAINNLHDGPLSQDEILSALETVQRSGGALWLAIHVEAQNAALIFHADNGCNHVIVEEFPTSASVADVLKTESALTWDFPSIASAVPSNDFNDKTFLENLTRVLEQVSTTCFDKFSATASKGGKSVVEVRDCASSALIGGYLMSLLEGIGTSVHPPQLRKRVRDDIVLGKSTVPWRRSPYWLVLRVTLGRLLSALVGGTHQSISRVYYKFIICGTLANLLQDCAGNLQAEMAVMLQAKLSRRLAKLESEKNAASGPLRTAYDNFFTHSSAYFHAILTNANAQVTNDWQQYKQNIIRRIPNLPQRASDQDLQLELPNSRAVFLRLLSQQPNCIKHRVSVDLSCLNEGTVSQVAQLANKYSALVDCGDTIVDDFILSCMTSAEKRCEELAVNIEYFIDTVGDAYVDKPLLMSRYLLQLFELWMRMDTEAIKACALLRDYHPIFVPHSLDVLCLQTRQEFERLNQVQQYLHSRINALEADHETIFDNPDKATSFPSKYVYSTEMGKGLVNLGDEIDAASEVLKFQKQDELADLTSLYDDLTQSFQSLPCLCTFVDGKKDIRGCERCWKWRRRKRINIIGHEDLLPKTDTNIEKAQRALILLQLKMPGYLSAYRSAVWRLHRLGTQVSPGSRGEPEALLRNFKTLQNWNNTECPITLASNVKRFEQTHYNKMFLPKQPSEVVFPFGAKFTYYDNFSSLWVNQLSRVPWFEHLLGSWVPKGVPDPYASAESLSPNDAYPPSSYAIVANEFSCPSELSVHEYSAFQRAVSGRRRRWLVIIVELGATNLNFSSESTMKLLNHLAVQAGPALRECGVLREAHSHFDNKSFCTRLHELLQGRLDAITSSWREAHYMNVLVTLSIRLYHLCCEEFRSKAESLLTSIRSITCGWIAHLRKEIRSTTEGEVASRSATFALWAALLNRRTFWVYKDDARTLNDEDTRSFFRASIALQENLLTRVDRLNMVLRDLLIEDMSNSYAMRNLIRKWFKQNYKLLEQSINETWTDSGLVSRRSYSKWESLSDNQADWMTTKTGKTQWTSTQVVHYHILQGHLIVDGKPLGRLPHQITQDPAVQELFGSQHLLTRPSGLLEYQLVNDVMGHQVHFGFRNGKVVIQALYENSLLEYVPRDIFKGQGTCDLPTDLVDLCVHWLDLHSGQLTMRRKPFIWTTQQSTWILNTRSRVAICNQSIDNIGWKQSQGSKLVGPRSKIGRQITEIFQHFEDVDKLTIYQPVGDESLSVEMKRLEIRFFVNGQGLLECPQLSAEVDPDQDAGTLYGLSSQIVLRNVGNPERRTVLVPIGKFSYTSRGTHVDVKIANEGMYASFSIDKVLGRLDCPPEPHLLYLKAAVHALTSFPLPDPLTCRTGTEEARHSLMAERSQPWNYLRGRSLPLLKLIRSLSPKRYYYPPGIDRYQKVEWDRDLTMWIQHEEYSFLIDSILLQSEQLKSLNDKTTQHADTISQEIAPSLLYSRGRIRRQLYERVSFPSDIDALTSASKVFLYDPNKSIKANSNSRVYQTICALQSNSNDLPKLGRLTTLVEGWGNIGGFEDTLAATDIGTLTGMKVPQLWGSLMQFSRRHGKASSYNAHFLLALLAFNTSIDLDVIRWLVAVQKTIELKEIEAPVHSSFSGFRSFEQPSIESIKDLILSKQPPHANFHTNEKDGMRKKTKLDVSEYESKQVDEAAEIASLIIANWSSRPRSADQFKTMIKDLEPGYVDIENAWTTLEPHLARLSNNLELSTYLKELEEKASSLYQEQSTEQKKLANDIWLSQPDPLARSTEARSHTAYRVPSLGLDLVKLRHESSNTVRHPYVHEAKSPNATGQHQASQEPRASPSAQILPYSLLILGQIIKRFSISSESTLRKQYSKDLRTSHTALVEDYVRSVNEPKKIVSAIDIEEDIIAASRELNRWNESIQISLLNQFPGSVWLNEGGLWPCLSPVSMLEQLRTTYSGRLSPEMKAELVHYGILITKLQRHLRVRDATLCGDDRRLRENEDLQAHSNWSPHEHPEWLLLEIDNNLLIRPSQIDVAKAIISPPSSSNSVLQMNMGQGKTSCIIPMAVAVLADRKSICRLVVPRALLLQTAQVVQSRIGGLVGRVVRHVPFSRRSPKELESIELYKKVHEDVRDTGGVMLCLPEHIMSFKLSGLQQLVDGDMKLAEKMTDTQRWLEANSRDILDESDFTLSTKTQLIYPSGVPMAIDGHPQRWLVVEELLSLVQGHLPYLQSTFSSGIDVMRRHEGYPIMHILRPEVEDSLTLLLIDDVCKGRLPQIQFKNEVDFDVQNHVRSIVSGKEIDRSTCELAAEFLTDEVFGMKNLYLLKGLLSEGLLLNCLKKRWNVQYGLHPQRAPIAVPFEAKGVPSLTAEYGHPDTTLILTCLAFYQTGLTQSQVIQCLEHVIRSDDPTMQYERLIHGCKLPARLECWNLLTLDDEAQMEDLWKHLKFDPSIINCFLNNFAFPIHAKQFGVKLQASGWDIPLLANEVDLSRSLTTGFSGTNDNKRLLPQTINQDDLPSLVQTNAEVLSYLLEKRNQQCYQATDTKGRHLTERGLLELLGRERIRILIDAGAYILEMKNKDLAEAWLDIFPDAHGAVYFDGESRVMVRARFKKHPMPLLASPFADNLEDCVVYIDEAHTRGTDLKLPVDARGAVTLGLGQTKDQTVQGAMRLRQLGSTQSMAFIVPPEVHRSILDLRPNNEWKFAPVMSSDVIYWLLEQSCKANEKVMPLHTAQGFDFCQRTNALWKYRNFSGDPAEIRHLLGNILQRENQTLEQLYGPRDLIPITETMENLDYECLKGFTARLCEQKLDLSGDYSSGFEELEVEREVEFEFEQLREKQKPVRYTADAFPGLDSAIIDFVTTGLLEQGESFIQAFDFLSSTKIGRKYGVISTSSRLFVSQEFTRSIANKVNDTAVEVMRPVEWILWSSETETALIVIPEEAELVLTMLSDSPNASVSLLTYAAPVTKTMWRFNTLDYFTIPARDNTSSFPPWLTIEIGVLAGRLYFSYSEYADLVSWLGLSQDELPAPIPDTFALKTRRVTRGLSTPRPLKFLLEWLTYRRQTQDIMHTPMGFLCQGKKLEPGHSFFSFAVASKKEDEPRPDMKRRVLAPLDVRVSDDDKDWEARDEVMIPDGDQMEGLDTDV